MADNVPITPGVGATIATDEVTLDRGFSTQAAIHIQRFKPVVGGDGVATDVSPQSPMPVADGDTANLLRLILVELRVLNSIMGDQAHAPVESLRDDFTNL